MWKSVTKTNMALLLDKWLDIEREGQFSTPIRASSLFGHDSTVQLLLNHGAKADGTSSLGIALQAAAMNTKAWIYSRRIPPAVVCCRKTLNAASRLGATPCLQPSTSIMRSKVRHPNSKKQPRSPQDSQVENVVVGTQSDHLFALAKALRCEFTSLK